VCYNVKVVLLCSVPGLVMLCMKYFVFAVCLWFQCCVFINGLCCVFSLCVLCVCCVC